MATNKPLGVLLKEMGYITEQQISVALDVQKAYPKQLGHIVQKLDFVTSTEIAQAVSSQTKTPFIELDTAAISKEALLLIPRNIAQSKNILPISLKDNRLMVATDNASDIMLLEQLRRVSKKSVDFVVADTNKIKRFIQLHYYQLENPIEIEIDTHIKKSQVSGEIDAKKFVELVLNNAIKDKATDVHISPDNVATHIFFRIDGVLKHYYSIPSNLHHQIIARIKIISSMDIAESRLPQDGGFAHEFIGESYDLRVSTLPTAHGENIVLRVLSRNITLFNLENLGFLEEDRIKLTKYFSKPYGIVLVTGPTGSGKTTTLYSVLRTINSLEKNILTIEDPIEYRFSFIKQTQINEKAGYNFAKAIKHFMRQDPDVMLVGEIRDEETANLAVRASITGHLVLSTLHTNNAIGAIPRLIDMGIKEFMVSSSLLAVIAQRLVRRLCPHCKKEVIVDVSYFDNYLFKDSLLIQKMDKDVKFPIYESVGCEACSKAGYIGRSAIVEILEVTPQIQHMISEQKNIFEIEEQAIKNGMTTMKDNAIVQILQGVTDIKEVERVLV